jgi:hypothetical protein
MIEQTVMALFGMGDTGANCLQFSLVDGWATYGV